MTKQLPDLVHRVNEVSARLKISRATFYRLVAQGELTIIKVGGGTFVSEEELQRFVRARGAGSRNGAPLTELIKKYQATEERPA